MGIVPTALLSVTKMLPNIAGLRVSLESSFYGEGVLNSLSIIFHLYLFIFTIFFIERGGGLGQ